MAPYRDETFTIGWRLKVFQTAPPQPASKARRTWYSELVGGALASQNGFGARTPQNSMLKSGTARLQRGFTPEAQRHRQDKKNKNIHFLLFVFSVSLW